MALHTGDLHMGQVLDEHGELETVQAPPGRVVLDLQAGVGVQHLPDDAHAYAHAWCLAPA